MDSTRKSDAPSGSPPGANKQNSSAPAEAQSSEKKALMSPVVRSKRTAIACTECRRRQVKCTGTTPQCERCGKRGIKCEYIPCSQQKAASSSPPMRPTYPEQPVRPAAPSYHSSPTVHRPTASWSPVEGVTQGFYSGGSSAYHQRGDWPDQSFGASFSESQVPVPYASGPPAHPRHARAHYSGEQYSQAAYGYQSFGDTSTAQPVFPSHNGYTGGPFPSGYPTPDVNMGSGDPALSFGYSADPEPAASQARIPSQQSLYPGQYLQGGNDVYSAAANALLPDGSSQGWSPDATYLSYQGHQPYC
ncbi:hypothetical protein NM688_g798 [Phlebia brevispora]|uniref:Uncharacterized protein n=1 Tax=Phlebia brevispora TaxID=194682 RepID=A0ACC1TE33_9APHY|nr:hypothetical protein NM688_g798 [Phlebia brevispora]